jgi:hypothetical protein
LNDLYSDRARSAGGLSCGVDPKCTVKKHITNMSRLGEYPKEFAIPRE